MHLLRSLLVCLFIGFITLSCTQPNTTSDSTEPEQSPADWLFRQRAFPSGELDGVAYKSALKQRALLAEAQQANTTSRDLTTAIWQFAGPINVGGRVTDVEMISGTPGTILVGAAAGGVFRSNDMGANWEAVFDEMPSLAVGDIALAPGNEDVIYVGTGEANAGGGSIAYDGLGVFRSGDGGTTWESRGLEEVGSIGRIVVDPQNDDRLYVAAMGTLFANNSQRGVYRSLDGGSNWEQVLFLSDSTGAIDLALHPSDPNTLYAAMWERVRRPDRRSYTGITSGIYKSTDGGTTWQELGNGLPTLASDKGRISLAVAPSDPNRIYAGFVNSGGYLTNMMVSENAGASWTNLPITDMEIRPYDWWFNRVVVHPMDADKLYYIGFNINEYLPEEERWVLAFEGVHVDQHSLWIDPGNPDFMLLGNDGGLYFSENAGQGFTKWNNLPITQFYTCEVDYQQPERLYGGTQDNGTNRTLTGATNDWSRIYFGDGFRVLVDPTDNNYVYAAYQYGNIARSIDGGNSFTAATEDLSGSRRNWYTPYVLDPTDPSRLYLGAERVFRSDDRAMTWQAISPDLSNGNIGANGLVFGTITSLSVSPLDNQIIWVGTDDGNVWISINGGDTWTSLSADLPERWVTSITADPNDPASAYLTFSGYRFGTNMSHVYQTSDYGENWQDINGDLPDIPVNDLVIHPDNGTLFLATDVGVLFSENNGANWQLLGLEVPPVIITDLTLHLPTETLVAATFGRSLWQINVGADVNTTQAEALSIDWKVYPNPTKGPVQIKVTVEEAGIYKLLVFNSLGQQVDQIFNDHLAPGAHQLSWDATGSPKCSYFLRWQNGNKVSSEHLIVE